MSKLTIERISELEYKNGLTIYYFTRPTQFGLVMIASTAKGVCFLGFGDDEGELLNDLKGRFSNAKFERSENEMLKTAFSAFEDGGKWQGVLPLHVYGADFQIKVWNELIEIPFGGLDTYGDIAERIGHPKASRAVGTAVGRNPVSYFIPCHRVLRSSGGMGGYYWGIPVKKLLLQWEKAESLFENI